MCSVIQLAPLCLSVRGPAAPRASVCVERVGRALHRRGDHAHRVPRVFEPMINVLAMA